MKYVVGITSEADLMEGKIPLAFRKNTDGTESVAKFSSPEEAQRWIDGGVEIDSFLFDVEIIGVRNL